MYPYEHSEDTWYYLAGLGGLILLDKNSHCLLPG